MNSNDVKEWMIIADDDFDSAKILNESVRKHNEVICYLCAQAAEKYLKTVISVPDKIFFEAEAAAKNMGVSRSTLYRNALLNYLKKPNRKTITKKLNEIYNEDYYAEFEPISNAGLAAIREATKDDTW
jgi:HEPN domain-containing protein